MKIKTKAIILYSLKYTENSVIVHAFTEEHGKMAYMVNGAKSKKSVLRSALLQPLSIIELETDFNPQKDIQRIKESRIVYPFVSIPFDPSKNALALFIAELLYRSIKETYTDKPLFDFLVETISTLDKTDASLGNFHLVFMIHLTHFFGFEPHAETFKENYLFDLQNGIYVNQQGFAECLNIEESRLFGLLLQLNYENMSDKRFSKEEKMSLMSALMFYYKVHLSSFSQIKSLEVLQQLFN